MSVFGSSASTSRLIRPRFFYFPSPSRTAPRRRYAAADSAVQEAENNNNPLLAAYLRRKRDQQQADRQKRNLPRLEDEEDDGRTTRVGALAPNSIFHDSITQRRTTASTKGAALGQVIPAGRVMNLDPMPYRRRRWERNMVVRQIQRRGRLTKQQVIKQTERSHVARSFMLRTSMKKLSPLANQIAGKTIEDAITQMRFSKKKASIAVREHLEKARDEAIVERGMGLGKAENTTGLPVIIKTKDGKRLQIKDRTSVYVSQAWVNKGKYGFDANPRARGRIDRLRLPQTSISVLLKEEATRVREHQERVEREKRKKVWTPLPDRPVTEQRQYYCW